MSFIPPRIQQDTVSTKAKSSENLDETSLVVKNYNLSVLHMFGYFTTILIRISILNRKKKKKMNHPALTVNAQMEMCSSCDGLVTH